MDHLLTEEGGVLTEVLMKVSDFKSHEITDAEP